MDIPPPAHAKTVEMVFRVHSQGQFSLNQRGYFGGMTGEMTFLKPAKVEWWRMVENLALHGYKGSAQLYYLDPAREAYVLMLGPEQVDSLLQSHIGTKICDLYIVNAEIDDDGIVNDGSIKDESDNDGIVIDGDYVGA
ncbi:unnamed protein product [Urochloa humidicola]